MKAMATLDRHRAAAREAASRFHTTNLRVFGSALRREDRSDSDLDLLVDPLPGATLFDLGIPVDLLTADDLPPGFRDQVLSEAVPV
jgi:predicted nucleotidyltransferase